MANRDNMSRPKAEGLGGSGRPMPKGPGAPKLMAPPGTKLV